MSETASKNSSKFPLKALVHVAGNHVVLPYALEYGICYVLTGVISSTLLHGAFNQPGMALGVMAAGLLVRNFTRQKVQQQPTITLPPMPPGLAEARGESVLSGMQHQEDTKPGPSPYM